MINNNEETKSNTQTQATANPNKPETPAATAKVLNLEKKVEDFGQRHNKLISNIKYLILIIAGNALVSYSFVGFVKANGFLSGGVWGLSGILTFYVPAISFPMAVFLFSLPCLIIGWLQLDKSFVILTSASIFLQIFFLNIFNGIVIYNNDPLLASIFAGVLLGVGDGLILRSGSGSSGIHLVSMTLKKQLGLSVSTISTTINLIIVAISTGIFGLEKGLYTLILIFISGKALSMVLDGISRKRTALIVTAKGKEIGDELLQFLHRGVTMMPGVGLYSMQDTNVLFCVVNVLEVGKLKKIVHDLDKNAFITIYETADISGHFIKNNAIVDKDSGFQANLH